jgi:SNF2 family DNA or RNA helicase
MLCGFGFLKVKAPKLRMLVMAPKSAIFQWRDSVDKFNVGLEPQVVGYDSRSGKMHSRFHRYDVYEKSEADVLLLSYHQMARDIDVILEHIENFVVVFDEVQTIKSAQQKLLYPTAKKLSQKAHYVWGASATPIMNRLDELYAIMDVINPGMFGSFDHFKRTYYQLALTSDAGVIHYEFVGYQNLPQLMLFMRPFYIKRDKAAIEVHLPEIVSKICLVDMEATQAHTYSQIVDKYFPGNAEFKARKLTKLASLTYCQMASDAPSTLDLLGGSSKGDELIRLLREEFFDEKIIVYARFERTVTYLSDRLTELGIVHRRITGKENPLERNQAKLDFNNLPDVNVILINDAGGEAIDLQAAGVMVMYDLPWSWGRLQQVIGRARRRGSTHSHLLVVLLMNRGTIDEHTFEVLQVKERLVSSTFGVEDSVLEVEESDVGSVSDIFERIRGQRAA